jgi:hypothetical protein
VGVYTSTAAVKSYSGVQAAWLAMTDEELDQTLERWIAQAEELVNAYTRTTWTQANVPEGVKSATERIVANMIAQARLHRRAGVIRTDQYGQREETPMPSTRLLTQAIKDDLELYKPSPRSSDPSTTGTIVLKGALARSAESEYPDTFGDWEHLSGGYPYVSSEQQP